MMRGRMVTLELWEMFATGRSMTNLEHSLRPQTSSDGQNVSVNSVISCVDSLMKKSTD